MNIPGLGEVTEDTELGWLLSEPVSLPVLNGHACSIVLDGYQDDAAKADWHRAIANFLAAPHAVLRAAEEHVFAYYKSFSAICPQEDEGAPVTVAADVWRQVQFGPEALVARRAYGDQGIYIALECNCDWEIEHGLMIVFKNGERVTKIGPYDGHLSYADSYDDPSLEDVIYA